MEKLKIYSNIEFCQIGELDNNDRRLVELAMEATDNSYSPYSKFRVGAAVRLSDGKIIKGANQENAAFSVTICAERSAILQHRQTIRNSRSLVLPLQLAMRKAIRRNLSPLVVRVARLWLR